MGSTISRFTKRPLFKGDPTWLIIFGQTARNAFLSTIEFSLGTDFFPLCCGCERSKRSTSWPLSVRNSRILWCCQQMNRTKPFVQVFVAWWRQPVRWSMAQKHASLGGLLSLFVMIPPVEQLWDGLRVLYCYPIAQFFRVRQQRTSPQKPSPIPYFSSSMISMIEFLESPRCGFSRMSSQASSCSGKPAGLAIHRGWWRCIRESHVATWRVCCSHGWMMVEWYPVSPKS